MSAILYENVNYEGRTYLVVDGRNIPLLAVPFGAGEGHTSSLKVFGSQWMTFWESPNYDGGDDSLWIAPPEPQYGGWLIDNLHRVARPHGSNHWGDRILSVSYSGPPTGSTENRTIWDGTRWTVGSRKMEAHEFEKEFGLSIRWVPCGEEAKEMQAVEALEESTPEREPSPSPSPRPEPSPRPGPRPSSSPEQS